MIRKILIVFVGLLGLAITQNGLCATENSPNLQPGNGHQSYSAIIKEVILIEYDGYTSVKYRVNWKGKDIIVPNTIQSISKSVGDTLKFLVMWHDLETRKGTKQLLAFSSLE